MNDLPAGVRRLISEYTPLEHNVRVECDVHSMAYADERVNGDNSFPLQLTVWMTLTFKLPRELDDEYIELMTEGREMNSRFQLRIGKPQDNGINIYYYLLQKQQEILQNDPQNSIQYVLFEDPEDPNDRDDREITFPARFTLKRQFLIDPRGNSISSEIDFNRKVDPVKQLCIDAIYYTIMHDQGVQHENTYMLSPRVNPLFKSSSTRPVDAITYDNVKETVKDGDRTRSIRSRKKVYESTGDVVGRKTLYETEQRILSMYKLQDDVSLSKDFLLGRLSNCYRITVFERVRVPENYTPGDPLQIIPLDNNVSYAPDGIRVILPVLPGDEFFMWTGLYPGQSLDVFYFTIVGNKQLPLGSGAQTGNTLVRLKL